ncbi:K(+)-transporting ATPase subunit F [Paenibacillus sp. KN14-4R]
MTIVLVLTSLVSIYLVYALINPEKF